MRDMDNELIGLIGDLHEDKVISLVRRRIKRGDDPFIIMDHCQKGMQRVGENYEKGIYYISGLIIAGDIMDRIAQELLPVMKSTIAGKDSGRVLLGTVEGDIHNLGKDLLKVLLSCYGFTVHDMGVDVAPEVFADAAEAHRPDIIGLSCLINSCYDSMKATITVLKDRIAGGPHDPAFVIGGRVDEQVLRHCNADYWTNDAVTGVRLCQLIMKAR